MIFLVIGLVIVLVIFLWCACKVSSKCSKIEEQEKGE